MEPFGGRGRDGMHQPAILVGPDMAAELSRFKDPIRIEILEPKQIWDQAQKGDFVEITPFGPPPTAISDVPPLLAFKDGQLELHFILKPEFLPQQLTSHFVRELEDALQEKVDPSLRVMNDTIYRLTKVGDNWVHEKVAEFNVSPKMPKIPSLPAGHPMEQMLAMAAKASSGNSPNFSFFPQDTKISSGQEMIGELDKALKILSVVLSQASVLNAIQLPPEKIVLAPPEAEKEPMFMLPGLGKVTKSQLDKMMGREEPGKELAKSIVVTDRPQVTFDDIKGQDPAVTEMRRVLRQLNEPEKYSTWGAEPPRGILLFGPPGTGKTMMAQALSNEAALGFVKVSFKDIGSKWYGESEKFADMVFDIALKEAEKSESGKAIIFLDEIDTIGRSRDSELHAVDAKVLAVFLERLQGFSGNDKIILVGATNRLDILDDALLSRMNYHIEVPKPDPAGLAKVLESHFDKRSAKAGRSITDKVDYPVLGRELSDWSPRELADLVNYIVTTKADQEALDPGFKAGLVTTDDIRQAAKAMNKVHDAGKEKVIGFDRTRSKAG